MLIRSQALNMQLALPLAVLVAIVAAECDLSTVEEAQRPLYMRVCALEAEVSVLENAVQELLQRADMTLSSGDMSAPQKRKNEFIRFGKRSATPEKRKNEFIRFGKRKNEFIRFGRSDPELQSQLGMEKRKNEFIRFG